ncbi:hypothetical protein [Methylobacterium dankookense]|uniref:Peptidase metallopeptidase domain-containing protein n=1 Tax=Methylobacterium dankookense TaxID=560405 RepID=A0A564FUZ2_9HYPH|nr:hypothetical protein [Methylobacterium dankookense]GJD57142.1 hypothetical protein IFDJLNFL_3042 [Methylobacterium dankookense]VUF11684.1 hypothetical protein MTDSW087_01368 [Methylobacterium dankookense]
MAEPETKPEPEIIPWPDRVRRTGELTVFPGPGFAGSVWGTVLDKAITAINQLLKDKSIALVFRKTDSEAGNPIVAETFPGSGLHGNSILSLVGSGDRERLGSLKLRVPANPRINGVDAGPPVRIHILVHELVHCIGLTNSAHSQDDVFIGKLVIATGGVVGGKALPLDGSGSVPPLKLGAKTVTNIKKAWELPASANP